MTTLAEPPALVWPTTAVQESYLSGERADCLLRGTPTDWLGPASADFHSYVAERRGVRIRWEVPSTVFWYVSGEHYLGTLVVRHRLTPELAQVGGHVGYHIVARWRRQGHATRMLAAGLAECRRLGLTRVLLTCSTDNEASRRVIVTNGGVPDGRARGEDRFWITVGGQAPAVSLPPWEAAGVTMRQGWESEAGNWTRFARTPGYDHSHRDINLPALTQLLPPPGRGTLDLACGEGLVGRVLIPLGYRVAGIDASPAMVAFAATHEERPEPAVIADAARLPFGDETFDLVVAYMCLHDIDAMPQAVAEVARVLEPGGRLCAAIPHPINTAGAFASRDAGAPFVISGSYLDPAPLRETLERGGIHLTFHSEHRPLEAYLRALEAAGLLTETLREVGSPDHVVASDPAARRWQRVPRFLHLRAVRPR